MTRPFEIHNLHIHVPKELYERFRLAAIARGETITNAVVRAMRLMLEKEEECDEHEHDGDPGASADEGGEV